MEYPQLKKNQIPAPSIELEWNKLDAQQYVVISREVYGSIRHFFGQVTSLEKLRNCHMLHFQVWECWSDGVDGYEYSDKQVNDYAGARGRDVPVPVSWKKPKGSVVRTWDPNIQIGYVGPAHATRANSYGSPGQRMPSDRTAEIMGVSMGSALDDMLKERANKRQSYVAARSLMKVFRDEMSEAFELLGLTYNSTLDDFKKVQRSVMKEWHPDREAIFVKAGGSVEQFRIESNKWTQALAKVKNALIPKQAASSTED